MAGGDGGVVKVRYGCEDNGGPFDSVVDPSGTPTAAQCNHADVPRADPGMPWDGKSIYADPGRINDTATPIGDIEDEFLPVGFDADGSLAEGHTLPLRTTAYRYDDSVNPSGSAAVPKNLVALPPRVPAAATFPPAHR
ncbi:MAG: hypothetical protein M5U19_04375 [Microthrixaceae bacterium]|nr:hypothetical protein [Microthrixaceae bacterium]